MQTATADTATAAVRALKQERDAAEVALLQGVVQWAVQHRVDDEVVDDLTFGVDGVLLGGVGCPLVREFDVYDLAASLGMSSDGGCAFVGRTLEVRYRLRRIWEQVVALKVPVWKAFKVADATLCLTAEAATHVDRHLAPVLHSCSFAQIERTITEAIDLHDPEEAERRRVRAADDRRFDVHLNRRGANGTDGTVEVSGSLDLLDALDLEDAVKKGAKTLGDLGCEESLDVRRSMAVGEMARNQLALDLSDTHGSAESGTGRGVTVNAHLSAEDLHATVDNPGAGMVLVEQLLEWCTRPGVFVKIQPIIDLNTTISSDAYTPSPRLERQVRLRDRCCVFPYCTQPAVRADLDHIEPYDKNDPARGGPTSSWNLAALCRRHHRAKTFSAWTYLMVEPGVYEWRSPSGARFRVTRSHHHHRAPITTPLDPDPPSGEP
jgi:hypothetical protein